MHLDAIHGWPVGDHTLPGHRWELLAHLENAIEDMINSGGAQRPLEAILQAALTAEIWTHASADDAEPQTRPAGMPSVVSGQTYPSQVREL